MKEICIRLIFFTFCIGFNNGCKAQKENSGITVSIIRDTVPENALAKKSSTILFESDFDSVFIKVRQDDEVIFDNILNTDDRSGFANSVIIENNKGPLEIFFKEEIIHLEKYDAYSYIRVLYWQNNLKIILTNTKPFFK